MPLLGLALLLGCLTVSGPALAWGPYAQEVIAFESGGPYVKQTITDDADGICDINIDNVLFRSQAAMPKAWEYAGQTEYAKTAEDFVQLMAKLSRGLGAAVQSQAWQASQIAEITGDNMFFGACADTCHERWFYELLVDAVLHGGNYDTTFPFDRVRVSVRPKQVAKASAVYVKKHGGELVNETAALAMAHDQAMAMLGERVLVQRKQFQENGLNNTMPGLWIPAMRTSADEVAKRLAGGLGNPDVLTSPKPNNIGRLGFELLAEMGRIVAGSGTGGIVTAVKKGTVVHEIVVKDQQGAEKVVIDFLGDKIWRMKTDPRTKTLCTDLLRLMTKDLHGWEPTPLWRDPA